MTHELVKSFDVAARAYGTRQEREFATRVLQYAEEQEDGTLSYTATLNSLGTMIAEVKGLKKTEPHCKAICPMRARM